jgi:hypothetical protein
LLTGDAASNFLQGIQIQDSLTMPGTN